MNAPTGPFIMKSDGPTAMNSDNAFQSVKGTRITAAKAYM